MQFDHENIFIDRTDFQSAIEIYLYKPHVVNKRVTTVRFESSQQTKRILISKNPRIYHDQEEEIVRIDDLAIEFRPIQTVVPDRKSCSVQLASYRFEYIPTENLIRLTVDAPELDKQVLWLRDVLFPKIVKWSQSKIVNATENSTLKLISIELYQQEYERLKIKYGKYLTSNWCESTDPQKHVFEDLGIASYLLVYFREYANLFTKPIKFVDLGCGNGLLTFLLSSEGYPGIGIDVRSRRSWSFFGSSLYLESLIDPHSNDLHELIRSNEYTFLIGNHSDELTPWIPILARRCCCDVFLLPCCFFDFSGKKFVMSNQETSSQYDQYLDHIERIAQVLEFRIKKDKLRIPSTKNICFILHQNFVSNQSISTCLLEHFGVDIDAEHAQPQNPPQRSSKPNFYAIKFSMIRFLFEYILSHESISLSTGYDLLSHEFREQLKSETGGLKSIILSYRQALQFDPQTKFISLADPQSNAIDHKQSTKALFKTKPCFFHLFHPQGCPLADDQCAFAHKK